MTSVLARGLDGGLGPGYDPGCAAVCHALGEPGLADGGWHDVARELGISTAAPGRWAAVPRALRRLGGVGCAACHGPGAIPEASARWSILRAEVCATCHDAPPRYPLVAGWRSSRMARADAAPGARAEGCRDCHTTAGFLAAAGVRPLGAPAPDEVGPIGIACAACHAPHGPHGARLVREGVCARCHPAEAAMLVGPPAPHASVPCTGCHDGVGHTFAVRPQACVRCHPSGAPAIDPEIATRAAAIPGDHGAGLPADAGQVREDRGAAAHNPIYARRLLEAAGRM
jgi:predicted CXXCH cytochrome family protein